MEQAHYHNLEEQFKLDSTKFELETVYLISFTLQSYSSWMQLTECSGMVVVIDLVHKYKDNWMKLNSGRKSSGLHTWYILHRFILSFIVRKKFIYGYEIKFGWFCMNFVMPLYLCSSQSKRSLSNLFILFFIACEYNVWRSWFLLSFFQLLKRS